MGEMTRRALMVVATAAATCPREASPACDETEFFIGYTRVGPDEWHMALKKAEENESGKTLRAIVHGDLWLKPKL